MQQKTSVKDSKDHRHRRVASTGKARVCIGRQGSHWPNALRTSDHAQADRDSCSETTKVEKGLLCSCLGSLLLVVVLREIPIATVGIMVFRQRFDDKYGGWWQGHVFPYPFLFPG